MARTRSPRLRRSEISLFEAALPASFKTIVTGLRVASIPIAESQTAFAESPLPKSKRNDWDSSPFP